jgi:hypothetical protein
MFTREQELELLKTSEERNLSTLRCFLQMKNVKNSLSDESKLDSMRGPGGR